MPTLLGPGSLRGGVMRVEERVPVGLLVVFMALAPLASCSSNSETSDGGVGGNADAMPFDVAVDGAAPRPGTVRMAVPAYFDTPSAQWDHLIAGAPAIGMIVFNPESGPGAASDPAYTQVI